MKIRKVTVELRDAVLCAYTEESATKVDFNSLSIEDQIKEIRKSGSRRASNLFRQLKRPTDNLLVEFLKRNPKLIHNIGTPKLEHVELVLEHIPEALNKLPLNKRNEKLVIQAVRPPRKVLKGPRDLIAKNTIKNIISIHPNTVFTPRVTHEIVRLMHGANQRDLKRLDTIYKKQKRKMPDELLRMISQLESRRKHNFNLRIK